MITGAFMAPVAIVVLDAARVLVEHAAPGRSRPRRDPDSRGAGSAAGALSQRTLTGPNSNRGWMRMPEPHAVLGAAAALAVLAICHAVVCRRSR